MSVHRLLQVLTQEFRFNLRRPLFWMALLLLLFVAWQFSTGPATISSGETTVGGQRAWNTSEFSLAMVLSVILGLLYSFFLAVAAGMSVIQDEEWRVTEMLRATPLRPGEYVWGKFLGVLFSFLLVLVGFLAGLAFFNHGVPNVEMAEHRGPFALVNYLRPTVVLGLPPVLFIAGTSFALGAVTRRRILVFLLPVVFFMTFVSFFWAWSPSWLSHEVNRLLMLLDPTGFRWLSETYLEVDRGAEFYNLQPVMYDAGILASRLVFVVLGLACVSLTPHWVGGRQRLKGRAGRGVEPPLVGGEGERMARGGLPCQWASSRCGRESGLDSAGCFAPIRELIHSPRSLSVHSPHSPLGSGGGLGGRRRLRHSRAPHSRDHGRIPGRGVSRCTSVSCSSSTPSRRWSGTGPPGLPRFPIRHRWGR